MTLRDCPRGGLHNWTMTRVGRNGLFLKKCTKCGYIMVPPGGLKTIKRYVND